MHTQIFSAVILLWTLFCIPSAYSKEFKAKVIGIADGDTIKVLKDNVTYRIRLRGIDCPEKSQPYGQPAKLLTSELAFDKIVSIVENGQDKYGRLIADVILPNHTSLSEDLVRGGYAWWYRQYAPKDKALAYAEADAKLDNLGIWSARYTQAPWEYRHQKRMHSKELSKISQNGLNRMQ